MQTTEEPRPLSSPHGTVEFPISVIIAVRNEAKNLPQCLASLDGFGEVYVVDSQSSDETVEIARAAGAKVVQFYYQGGWPKKRQWAIDTLPLSYDWILLLDADESLTPQLKTEIHHAVRYGGCHAYSLLLQMHFLGRQLHHGGARFRKVALFQRGQGHYECRTDQQNASMGDMEVHEHVVVRGKIGSLNSPLLHRNVESLSHYLQKHNEYSNWEVRVWMAGDAGYGELPPRLFGNQAQRRRWLKRTFLFLPGSPFAFFLYRYIVRAGFLDGVPGLIYCALQGIQFFHIKAKVYEARHLPETRSCAE